MRVFIAIDIDDKSIWHDIEKIQKYLIDEGVKGTFPSRNQLHITIKFLGDVSDEKIKLINEKLSIIKSPSFTLRFRGVTGFPSFKSPRVVVIKTDDNPYIQSLFKEIEKNMVSLGFKRENRSFSPHLTIARVKKPWSWKKYISDKLLPLEFNYEYLVDSFKLKSSFLTPNGPVYNDVFIYKLGGEVPKV